MTRFTLLLAVSPLTLWAIPAAALAQSPQCHMSRAADIVRGGLTHAQYRALYAFGKCVCGPEGWNDYSVVFENPRSQTFEYLHRFQPSCERNGWNGHRYIKEHNQ